MKTVTRHSVFETNSSSSHSISLSCRGTLDDTKGLPLTDWYLDAEGKEHRNCVVLAGGEFGWGPETHRDAFTKACYLAVYLKLHASQDEANFALFERVVKEATGATEIVYAFSDSYDGPNWSYIDHQSLDRPAVALEAFTSEETLKTFLFSRSSILVIDHDNH